MRLFILNDHVVHEIVNRLTLEDKVRDIILTIIQRYDYSLTNFIYSMFSVYTTYYANLRDENSHVSYYEAENIFRDLSSRSKLEIDRSNVFVADIYDIIFCQSSFEKSRFKGYFYEDMYNRLANLIGVPEAYEHMEEIFDAMETIFCAVEENLVFNIIQRDDPNSNVIMYLELTPHGLMIYVF